MTKIHYVSDLHLEFGAMGDLPDADVLIIAGDAAECMRIVADHKRVKSDPDGFYDENFTRCYSFFEKAAAQFDKVFYVIGNHEHYGFDVKRTVECLRRILPEKIVILDNEAYDFDDFRIIGGTLWTDFYNSNSISMVHCQTGMNDYKEIENGGKTLSPFHVLQIHKDTMEKFKELVDGTDKDVVMVSHHAPSFLSIPEKFSGSPLTAAYASDLSDFILDNPKIKHWIHGHIHDPVDYMIGGCNVVSNPRGYNRYEILKYSPEKMIEI